jgi:tetratricopeptide (TPR) repeat protein
LEYEEAIGIYDELITEYGEAEFYYLRGKCYIEQREYELAEADFDAAALKSTDPTLFLNIYQIYNDLQMNADGADYLERGLELLGNDDYYSRGLIYYYLQEYNNAKDALIQAINKNSDAEAMLLLGKVYLAMDDVASARAMYQEYVNDPEVAAEAYNGMALCDMEQGNYDSALLNIQSGLGYGDSEAEKSLLCNEICIYEQLGQWDMARVKVEEYLSKYPGDEAAIREQQFLNH